jgi:hypothetical protein
MAYLETIGEESPTTRSRAATSTSAAGRDRGVDV